MANTPSRTESGPTEEQFFKRIRSSTYCRIKLPMEFYKAYVEGKHIAEFMNLKSPLLSRPWKVTRVGDTLTDGWRGFVELHNLKRGDYVHFSHEGNFVFYVTTFSRDGDRILYRNNEISKGSTRKGKEMRAKDKAGVVIKEAGTSFDAKEKLKKGIATRSAVSDSFFKTVTKANLNSKSVYIPKKFVKDNCLEEKDLSFLGLLDSDHELWDCEVAVCTDDRLKITKGWAAFCKDNNLEVGDCCEFKLQSDYEEIMLELVGVCKDGKKPVGRNDKSSDVIKDEYELEEDDGSFNADDVEMISMETFFNTLQVTQKWRGDSHHENNY